MLNRAHSAEPAHVTWLCGLTAAPLSVAEERRQLALAQAGDPAARTALTRSNMRFVHRIAAEYAGSNTELLLELIAVGYLGLLDAIDRFDLDRPHKFITYAVWWIRQKMLYYLNSEQHTIRLPVNITDALRRRKKAGTLEAIHTEDSPSAAHLRAGIAATQTTSLDIPADEEHNPMVERLADDTPRPDAALVADQRRALIDRVLSGIDPRKRAIVIRYFGLDGEPAQTLEEIGADFNLTRERIRQLKDQALHQLRQQPALAAEWRVLCD